MGLIKGVDAIKKAQKEVEKKMQGTSGTNFYLKSDGDSALIRFLIDGDELIAGQFHRASKTSSRTGTTYWEEILCTGENDCPYCNSNDPNEIATSFRFVAWIYVYEKRHDEQLDDAWEATEVNGDMKFIEKIDKPMILRHGYNLSIVITGIYTKYGSLIDRDFEIARIGEGLQTRYSILPEEKVPMSKEVEKVRKSIGKELDSLEDLVMAKPKEKPEPPEEDLSKEDIPF